MTSKNPIQKTYQEWLQDSLNLKFYELSAGKWVEQDSYKPTKNYMVRNNIEVTRHEGGKPNKIVFLKGGQYIEDGEEIEVEPVIGDKCSVRVIRIDPYLSHRFKTHELFNYFIVAENVNEIFERLKLPTDQAFTVREVAHQDQVYCDVKTMSPLDLTE